MKNVLITIFFILSFAPMFAQTVPEKEIDFEGSFIMDDARSASLPIEAYLFKIHKLSLLFMWTFPMPR